MCLLDGVEVGPPLRRAVPRDMMMAPYPQGDPQRRAAASGTENVSATVRILHLEDDDTDADLVRVTLKRAGLDSTITRVITRDGFLAALGDGAFDIILADFNMPDYDGLSALRASRETSPETPFIFVSGAIGEDVAIGALHQGATDYVLKDKLARLATAVERALAEVESRRRRAAAETAQGESEELLRTTIDHAPLALFTIDRDGVFRVSAGAGLTDAGLEPGQLVGQSLFEVFKDRPEIVAVARGALAGERLTCALRLGKGTFETFFAPIIDHSGAITGAVGIAIEIGERLRAEKDILALNADLERRAYEANAAQQKTYIAELETLQRLALAAEYRDEGTGTHIVRMSRYCVLIGRNLGLPEEDLDILMHAAPMHDIGKLGIPDSILLKPGKLDADEWDLMKQHSAIGSRILGGSSSTFLKAGEIIAASHHEKWDGSGYPIGLVGEDIPLTGRIAAIADVFDALTTKRPYKEAFPFEKAVEIVREGRGAHFDPQLLDFFLGDLDDVHAIHDR
jgi:PAS domain S-box-containing protein